MKEEIIIQPDSLYEGNEPYIFVSYSHKNLDKVLPIIDFLMEKGYRVWYDQGLHPGHEWPEVVAQRLNDCAVFMVFVSEDYMQSQNCIRELHFAVSKRKSFLSIILDDVKLSPGIEMQLCVSQAIMFKKYRRMEDFYRMLLIADVLPQCLVPEPEPEPLEEKEVVTPAVPFPIAEKPKVKKEKPTPAVKEKKKNPSRAKKGPSPYWAQ